MCHGSFFPDGFIFIYQEVQLFRINLDSETKLFFKRCDLKLRCCDFDLRLSRHLGETIFNSFAT